MFYADRSLGSHRVPFHRRSIMNHQNMVRLGKGHMRKVQAGLGIFSPTHCLPLYQYLRRQTRRLPHRSRKMVSVEGMRCFKGSIDDHHQKFKNARAKARAIRNQDNGV